MTIATAGYIIYDNNYVIHGAGASVDEAWHYVRADLDRPLDIEGNPVDDETWFEFFYVRPATYELLDAIYEGGGDLLWDTGNYLADIYRGEEPDLI